MESEPDLEAFRKALEQPAAARSVPHRACICDKLLNAAEHTARRYSGIVNFEECFCPDCRKEFEVFVRVVCLGCKTLVALQKPGKVATGFEFKRGTCVHVEKCPACADGLTAVPVLEHLRYCRSQGMPTNVDKDIVQEAEQKSLQATAAADKLRAELTDKFAAP
jgi:hypothetical protein